MKHMMPQMAKSPYKANILISYILTLPHPQVHVRLVKCGKP